MRLTLRTMLAYMDEILEPDDHQDIGRKIEESEFANSLVHRIRDVSRRMRLAAPKVAGRGMGLDPNTVAEYIDNELPGERVPDFEKVCLESDIHLAEVACCHQVLALVQVQPAEVDPGLRRRMYEMGVRADEADGASEDGIPPLPAAAAAVMSATDAGSRPDAPVEPVRSRPEVPDYLRSGSRSKFWPITITAVLALCLVAAIILASGPLDGTNPVLKLFGFGGAPETAQTGPAKSPSPKADQPQPTATTSGTGDKTAASTVVPADKIGPDLPAKSPAGDVDAVNGTVGPGKSGLTQPSTGLPAVAGTGTPDGSPPALPPAPSPDAGTAPPAPRPDDAPVGRPLVATIPPDAGPAVPPVAGAAVPPATGTPVPPVAGVRVPPVAGAIPPAPTPFDPGEQRIGRLLSNDQEVLLRMAAGKAEWHRIAQGGTFNTGDKLLVLPTFRPMVTLASGITLQLAPETLIEFDGVEQGIPVVRVDYGRMVVMTTGKPDVKIKLALGDSAGFVNFDDAEATIAIEVRPYHLPGTDPETHQPRLAITIYGVNGEVSCIFGGGKTEKLHAPSRLVLAGDPLQPVPDREVPKWVGAEPVSPLEVRASQSLNESLDEKRPVTQTLLEMSAHRREENRSLAARSLALIDEFEPFDVLLNDERERSVWPIQIESLQAALARGPAVAAKVRAAFEKQRGKDGTELYRMLWGYSKDDLAGGAATHLVEYLDHDNMDFRVLSFHNLRMIAGTTFNYRPEQSAANRQQPVRRWKEQLKDGMIGPKTTAAGKAPPAEPAHEQVRSTTPHARIAVSARTATLPRLGAVPDAMPRRAPRAAAISLP